jgi:hypothetical protein
MSRAASWCTLNEKALLGYLGYLDQIKQEKAAGKTPRLRALVDIDDTYFLTQPLLTSIFSFVEHLFEGSDSDSQLYLRFRRATELALRHHSVKTALLNACGPIEKKLKKLIENKVHEKDKAFEKSPYVFNSDLFVVCERLVKMGVDVQVVTSRGAEKKTDEYGSDEYGSIVSLKQALRNQKFLFAADLLESYTPIDSRENQDYDTGEVGRKLLWVAMEMILTNEPAVVALFDDNSSEYAPSYVAAINQLLEEYFPDDNPKIIAIPVGATCPVGEAGLGGKDDKNDSMSTRPADIEVERHLKLLRQRMSIFKTISDTRKSTQGDAGREGVTRGFVMDVWASGWKPGLASSKTAEEVFPYRFFGYSTTDRKVSDPAPLKRKFGGDDTVAAELITTKPSQL